MSTRKLLKFLLETIVVWFCYEIGAPSANAALPTHIEIREAFDAVDLNGDHAIDPHEWRAVGEALFACADKNHDRRLTRSELGDNARRREAFPDLNWGGNDQLPRPEFLSLRAIIFRAADIDHDDALTFAEYELLVLLRRTGWVDRNLDGRIEMSELRQALAQAFDVIDANHDYVLSGNETGFLAPAHFTAMDPKNIGCITLDQLANGYRFVLGADQSNRNLVGRAAPLKS